MQVIEKLGAVEDELFQEMDKIEKQIVELKTKLNKLKELGRVMNPERFKKLREKDSRAK
jgi:hypothetical protein